MTSETSKKPAARMRSMTGFAQTVSQQDGFSLTVTLRSVNHRSLDLHLTLAESLQQYEPLIRKEVGEMKARGHLQIRAALETGANAPVALNEALIGQYVDLFRKVGERYNLSLETALGTLPQLPGVIAVSTPAAALNSLPDLEAALLSAVRRTLEDWDRMRAREGMALEDDLRSRTLRCVAIVEQVEQLRGQSLPLAQKKWQERVQSLLGAVPPLDSGRLAQELAMLAERSDVTEELLRLKTHFGQFLGLLEGSSEVGKKLEFLLQEIQRETNTLLAKTAGLGENGLAMTQAALEIKAETEKLREQALNVQ